MRRRRQLSVAERSMVEDNLGLVGMVVNKVKGVRDHRFFSYEEFFSYGVEGLIAAVKCRKTTEALESGAFSTYATKAIGRSIFRAMEKEQRRFDAECQPPSDNEDGSFLNSVEDRGERPLPGEVAEVEPGMAEALLAELPEDEREAVILQFGLAESVSTVPRERVPGLVGRAVNRLRLAGVSTSPGRGL